MRGCWLEKKGEKEQHFPDVKLHLHFDFCYLFHFKKILPVAWSQKIQF